MRDIEDYESHYLEGSFEPYQVKYRRRKVLERVQQYRHDSILEIGCGMEPLFTYVDYKEYMFYEPGGVFYSHAINLAKNDKRVTGVHAPFTYGAPLVGKHFDVIILSSLLHEAENPDVLLGDIVKAMDDTTVLHINVPNANSFHRVLAKYMGLITDTHEFSEKNKELQQHNVFDMDSLAAIVKKHGLKIQAKGGYFLKPFTHEQMYQMMEAGIINDNVLDGLYAMTPELETYGSEIYVDCMK